MGDDFYEDQEEFVEDEETREGEGEESAEGGVGPEGEEEKETYLTQDDFDRVLKRKHAQWERKFARRLGFKTVEEAMPYLQAGQMVSQQTQVAPGEIVNRLSGTTTPLQPGTTPAVNPMEQRLDRIEGLLEDDRTAKILKTQEAEARKEFGVLYEKYQDEIEDKADELGLPLQDAAAIVLRPHLQEHFQAQTVAKKQAQRRKKLEGSGDAASNTEDVVGKLTPAQKRVARKMNLSYQDYYKQLKELGRT